MQRLSSPLTEQLSTVAGLFILYIWVRCRLNPALGPALEDAGDVPRAEKMRLLRAGLLPLAIFATMMVPFVNGWTKELDAFPAPDAAKAKSLLEEAGYGDGFTITLNCPNDRYINDEAICQAVTGMLGKIGIKVTLDSKPKAQHFPLIKKKETDFYMLGWGVPTFDSEYIFNLLVHTTTDKLGSWNGTRYSNPELDTKIQALASETDAEKRNAMIAEIWDVVKKEHLYAPVHHQVLNWGMKNEIDFDVQPGEVLQVKVALSSVGIDGALQNLAAEAPGWDFDRVRREARDVWNRELGRIDFHAVRVCRGYHTGIVREGSVDDLGRQGDTRRRETHLGLGDADGDLCFVIVQKLAQLAHDAR